MLIEKRYLLNRIKNISGLGTILFAGYLIALLKNIIFAAYFGVSVETDAYNAAFSFIDLIQISLLGSLAVFFIPQYINYKQKLKNDDNPVKISVISISIMIIIITLILCLFPKNIIHIFYKGFDNNTLELSTKLLKIMSPLLIIFLILTVLKSILNAEKKYFLPGMEGIVRNIIVIGAMILLAAHMGIFSIVAGMWIGLSIYSLIIIGFILKKDIKITAPIFKGKINISNINKTAIYIFPLIFASFSVRINYFIDKIMASFLGIGNLSILVYANIIIMMIHILFTSSANTVYYTELSDSFAKDKPVSGLFSEYYKLSMLILWPIAVLIICYSDVIVKILYLRGNFDSVSINEASLALKCYTVGLFTFFIHPFITKYIVIKKMIKILVIFTIFNMLLNIVLNYFLMNIFGISGIALATSGISTVMAFICFYLFRKEHINIITKENRRYFYRMIIITIFLFLVNLILRHFLNYKNIYIVLITAVILNSAIYLIIIKKYNLSEFLFKKERSA